MEWALIPAAFVAGVCMFLAPCTLPIVPGYLAFIAGTGDTAKSRNRIVINALAFIAGFSIIFISLGASAGFIGSLIGEWREYISRAAGAVLILFGLTMLGILRLPGISSEHRIRLPKFLALGHWQSSLLIGVLFALGWSPCVGPILATVLYLASSSATAAWGGFLLLVFSLGLGLPFLLTAILMQSGRDMFGKWAKTSVALSYIGGAFLVVVGALMLTGNAGLLIQWGFAIFEGPYAQLLNYM